MSVPRRLAHYEVINKIGEGGMSAVYLARDRRSGDILALKVLEPELAADPSYRARFLREAEYGQLLQHPNLISVRDVGEAHLRAGRRSLFMVMEHVRGRDLLGLMARHETPPRVALRIGAEIAAGLAAAHDFGIVHRDVKPANVLAAIDQPAKLIDFGLALPLDGARGRPGLQAPSALEGGFVGTLGYAAPEQLAGGGVDARSDLFALGVVLFQLLCSRMPYPCVSQQEFREAVQSGAPALAPGNLALPPSLCALVQALLEGDPSRRPTSADEVREALRAAHDLLTQLPAEDAAGANRESPGSSRRAGWLERLWRTLGR